MRARVVNGKWVFEDPVDLPEGTVVEIITRPAPAAGGVYVDEKLRAYIHALLAAACSPKYHGLHAAPNAHDEQEITERAKACAKAAQRAYTTPMDIQQAARDVLGRMVAKIEAVDAILDDTPLP